MNYCDMYNKCAGPCNLNYKNRNKWDGFLYPSLNRGIKSPTTLILTSPTAATDVCGNFSPSGILWNNNDSWANVFVRKAVSTIDEPDYMVCS